MKKEENHYGLWVSGSLKLEGSGPGHGDCTEQRTLDFGTSQSKVTVGLWSKSLLLRRLLRKHSNCHQRIL